MIKWPDNKSFAFSIVDDTDCTTLENSPMVYAFLRTKKIFTTKTVWMFDGEVREDNKRILGQSCENEDYLQWALELQKQGFEIGLHSSSWSRMTREKVVNALDLFKTHFGHDPFILAQHIDTLPNEAIYWGRKRVSGFYRLIYNLIMLAKGESRFIYQGDEPKSPYFWGDICQERIKYVRNFVFPEINTLKASPKLPYYDPERPYVKYWFSSTEGPNAKAFNQILCEKNQKKLEEEGGACIIYTHFGSDFIKGGKLDPVFIQQMTSLSQKNGWFVPTSQLLDFLLTQNGPQQISSCERSRMERKWLWHKIRVGTT